MNRLDGKRFEFFGVNENCFQVREIGVPEKRVFEAIEDESDGYRSCLGAFEERTAEEIKARNLFFSLSPFAVVTGRLVDEERAYGGVGYGKVDFLELVDDNGHVWLTAGTENTEDYYPGFVFTYSPLPLETP